RHSELLEKSMQRIVKQPIHRLARRAGAMRISRLANEEIRKVLKVLFNNLKRDAMIYRIYIYPQIS
ncbi:hypothetical protein Angca_005416, partial [Angiostrongylus cantonensis]